jgi:hypothetical protein
VAGDVLPPVARALRESLPDVDLRARFG